MISQKVVLKFFVHNDRVCYDAPAYYFGDCIIWRGASYLVFKKSCFFDIPLDHKVYTDIHQMHVPSGIITNRLLVLARMSQHQVSVYACGCKR